MSRAPADHPADRLATRFPSRRALIFGAASGLGLETARLLLADAWNVGAVDIDCSRLNRELAESGAWVYGLDVRDSQAVESSVAGFADWTGGIDVLVNAAGIGAGGLFETLPVAVWRDVIDVNLLGTVHACHAVLPTMRSQGAGHIINIASAAAFHALPRVSAYNASKAAVLALSETLASELHGTGIGVTVKMSTFYRSRLPELTLGDKQDRELTRRLADRSGLDAATVAAQTLRAAGRGRLYLVTPGRAKVIWAVKRHAPRTYQRLLPTLNKMLLRRLETRPASKPRDS
jgi:NAD(P)-dependent dehydrogenase (short-subunit alcohol dehydrogenase family)